MLDYNNSVVLHVGLVLGFQQINFVAGFLVCFFQDRLKEF